MERITSVFAAVATRLPAALVAATAIFLLVATTTGFFWIDSWHDEQRAAQLGLLAIVAVVFGWLHVAAQSPRLAPTIIVALALGVVSSLLSGKPVDALAEVTLTALLCLLAAIVGQFASGANAVAVRGISRAALFIAVAHGVGAVARYAAALEVEQSFGAEIWLLGFSNPRVASSFYALLIPITALGTFPLVEPNRCLRGFAWASLVTLWATAAGLEARALWLSYGLAVPALLALAWSPDTRRLVTAVAITAVAGVVIQFALPLPSGPSGAASSTVRDLTSLSSRDVLWGLALDATLQHPLLGVGPGQFTQFESFAGAHPHNWLLQLASEWGVPVLGAALVGLFRLFRELHTSPSKRSHEGELRAASALAVLVGLASALVDGTLVMPTTQVAFALVFGLFLGTIPRMTRRRGGIAFSAIGRWNSAVAIVASACLLCAYGTSSYAAQEAERAAFRKQFPGKWLVPRFWESGLALLPRNGSPR